MFWKLFKTSGTPEPPAMRASSEADDTAHIWQPSSGVPPRRGAMDAKGDSSPRSSSPNSSSSTRSPSFEDVVVVHRRRGGIDLTRASTLDAWAQARDPWGPPAAPSAVTHDSDPSTSTTMPAPSPILEYATGRGPGPLHPVDPRRFEYLREYAQVVVVEREPEVHVLRAVHRRTGMHCVIRAHATTHMLPSQRAALDAEASILEDLAGAPGYVHLLQHAEDDAAVYMVLESADGGSLAELIMHASHRRPAGGLGVEAVRDDIIVPLVHAFSHMHEQGMLHRNLSPNSISLGADGVALLADFRHATRLQSAPNDCVGAQEYAAPELVAAPTLSEIFQDVLNHGADENDIPAYTTAVDVWALGAMTYELLTGKLPFGIADDREGRLATIVTNLASMDEMLAPLPADAAAFVRRCLQFRADDRASMAQLLSDPWIADAKAPWSRASSAASASSSGKRAAREGKLAPTMCAAMHTNLDLSKRTRASLEALNYKPMSRPDSNVAYADSALASVTV